jgi:hypothetical protein
VGESEVSRREAGGLLIAGTHTPFGLLALSGTFAAVLLAIMWSGAIVNVLVHALCIDAPKSLSAGRVMTPFPSLYFLRPRNRARRRALGYVE